MTFEKKSSILLIVPPFALLESPSLGVHSLQKIAKEKRYKVKIIYANHLYSKYIGVDKYHVISNEMMTPYEQIPERIFAQFAYNSMPFLGKNSNKFINRYSSASKKSVTVSDLLGLEFKTDNWLNEFVSSVLDEKPKIVGLSTSHQQTNASIAIINRIKEKNPDVITIIGGSNCEGNMSFGIQSLSPHIDYIFSGESELIFTDFLNNLENGNFPSNKIIKETKPPKIDQLPLPDFDDFYNQLDLNQTYPEHKTWIPYESSRNCWWGVKNLCTFCGINGDNPNYRQKKPKKVLSELLTYSNKLPSKNIRMVDVLMPRNYLKTLIPIIKTHLPDTSFFYEQRADLSFSELKDLFEAGIEYMQIGIESFSNGQLLKLNKGTTVRNNIDSLRFARSLGIIIGWNMLTEIPNDEDSEWESINNMLPLLYHLNPPLLFRPVEITRFSPYFKNPENYGISDIKPFNVYSDIYPEGANIHDLSWLFTGNYECSSRKNKILQNDIFNKINSWIKLWSNSMEEIPVLEILKYDVNKYLLRDTRPNMNPNSIEFITKEQASVAILGSQFDNFDDHKSWALQNNLIIESDNDFIPIATCNQFIFCDLLNNQ